MKSWRRDVQAGARVLLLRLPASYPRDRRCTLVLHASAAGAEDEQRVAVSLA